MKNASIGLLLFLIVLLAVAVWRYHHLGYPDSDSVERTKILMDTLVRIEAFDKNGEKAQEALEAAFSEIERLSSIFSHHMPESEVSGLNRSAGERPRSVSEELYTVLQRSIHFSKSMGGAFDVTVGVVSQLWDFTGEEPRVPRRHVLEEKLRSVDYGQIVVEDGPRVGLRDSTMAVDLGGVAKGYAVDRAVAVLKEKGITRAIVEAGGDIGLLGSKPKGQPWHIGVQHPRDIQSLVAVIKVDSGSVATSGDYERFFVQDGQRYHHILDPKTGWPSRSCISVTVLSQQAMDADILATGVFVLGPEKGLTFIEDLEGIEGLIFYEKEGRLEHVVSHGLRDRVTFRQ